MRLIDADWLKSYIDCGHLRPPTEVCFSELDVCNIIDKAPTVSDAFSLTETMKYLTKPHNYCEVIRCKDCRWCQDDYMGTWCGRFSGVRFTNADDFCSHGERAEQTEYKLPGHDEVMEALDKLKLKPKKESEENV